MPNPVSSSPNQSLLPTEGDPSGLECVNPATTADANLSALPPPEVARPDANRSESSPGSAVDRLVAHFSKPSTTGAPVEQSLYRHDERSADGELSRASMGVYNLRNSDGSSVTLLEVSMQNGEDKNAQLTVESSNFSIEHRSGFGLSLSGDVGVVRANLGTHNDDGSVGHNIGVTAEAAGIEATVTTPVASLTLGASVSAGLAGSSGVRDADHDGKPEYCARVSIPAFTVGACLERFW